jgi:DNA-binding response OmpR family regulator
MSVARILLIEDEATSREILELVLSGAGYTVDVADTAAAAHKQLSSARYALVIADWLCRMATAFISPIAQSGSALGP